MESMTGFGKGVSQNENFIVSVYAKSVNHRYLDIVLRLPKRYVYLEEKIRKEIAQYFERGKIDITIKCIGISPFPKEIFIDFDLAKKLKESIESMKETLGFKEELSLSDFVRFRDYLILEEKEEELEKLWEEIAPALKDALLNLKTSREKEGEILKNYIIEHLKNLKNEVLEIEKIKDEVINLNKNKFKERIEKLFKEFEIKSIDENRLYQEIAYLLDRLDFTEELERLKTHITHFEEVMEGDRCGKKLDFLCQEMFREINTLSNKAQSSEISLIAVRVKDIIEKIREQVQNIA
ncbi:MAG: YicC family protein [Thermodesulfobacteriota bacterium]|nr:MAG: YicC family protein [Thermodesulfobacteriota bacterium]